MEQLLLSVKQMPEYPRLLARAKSGGILSFYGLAPIHRAHIGAALFSDLNLPFCFITKDEGAAAAFKRDFNAFCGSEVDILPSRDFIFHNIDGVSRQSEQQRIGALMALTQKKKPILVAPADALMLRTIPPQALKSALIELKIGGEYDIDNLVKSLVSSGYARFDSVEGPGQFALRGGILDVFPAGGDRPVRAEFFGDTVDSLGYFDPMSQRRQVNAKKALFPPCKEALPHLTEGGIEGLCRKLEKAAARKAASAELRSSLSADVEKLKTLGDIAGSDKYMPYIYNDFATAFDYLKRDTVFIFLDTPASLECAKGLFTRHSEDVAHLLENGLIPPPLAGFILDVEGFKASVSRNCLMLFDSFLSSASGFEPDEILSIQAKQLPTFSGNFDIAMKDISDYLGLGYKVYAFSGGKVQTRNFSKILEDNGVPTVNAGYAGGVSVYEGSLSSGFEYPALKIAAVCEGAGQKIRPKSGPKKTRKNAVKTFSDLVPGDLVVHDHHGIGRFVGVEQIKVDEIWRDYIKIAFAGTDFVYVPATALDLVSKYIGSGEGGTAKLSKLGGTTWARSKLRAKKSAADLAEGLLELYSKRQNSQGFAFQPDDDWQRSFEESFPFEETEDQLVCAQEIKNDMEKPVPMDRLLCGDVGFGKTEVAFRAIMKCLLGGKQAAILVPTTVLARQHYISAQSRFSGHPVNIEMMSRFRTKGQLAESARHAKNGTVDLLIGTHRILQKDVSFKNLGLLVVDEEQRFGVSHKEAIKRLATNVDVLTLTATPIPRTLNMALSGIRDMSALEEAPEGRLPVQTYVLEHDDGIIRDAIRRELSRGGQVYYLHNRIDSIDLTASRLQAMFPEHVVAVVHGRMDEGQISDVMNRTYSGEVSVLVCTTIIETGLDIPNVNTLIIEDADHLGLAQLHQIRGRVGRSARSAYAYFTYRRGKVLTEISQKRLSAIREFAQFGSGFKIAMRDLEIRGAGNVLGAEQSGHMMNVGYDMYLRLLEEATLELKGEKAVTRTQCTADIMVSAGLPQGYVKDAAQRVDLYRRIALISSVEDYDELLDELIDRFGDPPQPAISLLKIALLRADASKGGIYEITQKSLALYFYFATEHLERAAKTCALPEYKGRLLLSAGDKPYFVLKLKHGQSPLEEAISLISLYSGGASW